MLPETKWVILFQQIGHTRPEISWQRERNGNFPEMAWKIPAKPENPERQTDWFNEK
jgi:hypothetical protein